MAAISRQASGNAAGATTRLTSPMASASSAPTRRPVKISSLALPRPTSRGSRWVPPAPGMMASRVSGQPHGGRGRSDADIAGQGQLRAAAQGDPVDGGDHRFVEIFDIGKKGSNGEDKFPHPLRRQGGPFLEIRPGAKGLFPGTGHDDHPHPAVESQRFHGIAQGMEQIEIEAVHDGGPVEGQGDNPVLLRLNQYRILHVLLLFGLFKQSELS